MNNQEGICSRCSFWLNNLKTTLKMRSAQTHFCAWAIMKKFIYLCIERTV